MKNRIKIAQIWADPAKYAAEPITVCGWARTIRDMKNFGFLELNDGSAFKGLQVVLEREKLSNYDELTRQNVGAAFIARGMLVLTPEGRQSMEMFASRIRASQQEKLETHSKAWRRRVRDELSMPADWEQKGSAYAVTLRALESGEEIFSMKLTAATKVQAKRFCARWPESAPYLYQTIMARLGEVAGEETAEKPEDEN